MKICNNVMKIIIVIEILLLIMKMILMNIQ